MEILLIDYVLNPETGAHMMQMGVLMFGLILCAVAAKTTLRGPKK